MSRYRIFSAVLMTLITVLAVINNIFFIFVVCVLTAGGLYEFFYMVKRKGIPIYSYVGIFIGITGSLLLYDHEIDARLNPQRYAVTGSRVSLTYAEYVAGGSTLAHETGVRMWKENPQDGTGYQYFKYYMLVKYLLEHDKLSVDDLFNRDFDLPSLEERVLKSL